MSKETSLFISYARSDDEPFVKRLHADLEAHGFNVWWDRVAMESRGKTFLQEIRDAITTVDRVLLVIGPLAVQSDYVRAEWEYALEICKVVVPMLRLGDRRLLPSTLAKLHTPDFRPERPYTDALTELVRILSAPIQPPGSFLSAIDALPPHFLARPEAMARITATVLADTRQPTVITSAQRTTALEGMGGVGKSVLAASFAHTCETRRSFTDGIIWLKLGQQPDSLENLRKVGMAFGDEQKNYITLDSSKARLVQVLAHKRCLLVLDDLWNVRDVEPYVEVLGQDCRLLITTRDIGLASALGAQECPLDVLVVEQSLLLLSQWVNKAVEVLPEEARSVADECGNLPFALALCGAMVRDGILWKDLLNALHAADLTYIEKQLPNYYSSVLKSLQVSVDALARSDTAGAQAYLELAVFPAGRIPEAAILRLWGYTHGLSEREARKLLVTLDSKSLLRLEGEPPERHMVLHDLQYDYLRAMQGDITAMHNTLLEAYRHRYPDGWPSGPNDGYFFEYLPYHLTHAERSEDLRSLLFNFEWLQAKLAASGIAALIGDYEFLPDDIDLHNVQDALRLAAPFLIEDKSLLPGQLLGRLQETNAPGVQSLLEQARQWNATPWLRPIAPSLSPAGGPLRRTFTGHSGYVSAVAVTLDGRWAISASGDTTLKVWDLQREECLYTLKGHTSFVTTVVLTPDGRRAISASGDATLRVWDLETGTELHTLLGHTGVVDALAVTPDGRRVISGSDDKTIRVWDLQNGTSQYTLHGHSDSIEEIAVTPNGRCAVSASQDKTLKVWNLDTGTELHTLGTPNWHIGAEVLLPDGRRGLYFVESGTITVWDRESRTDILTLPGHGDAIWTVAVTADGRHAISGSRDNTLKVWDLDTGTELRTLKGHTSQVYAVAVTQDGQRIVSGSFDKTLRVWELETGKHLFTLQGHSHDISHLTLTPDGRRAISGSTDNTLKIWDLEKGVELGTLFHHTGQIRAIAILPDGRHVLSASNDSTLNLWNLERIQRDSQRDTAPVRAIKVTAEGRYAISASTGQLTGQLSDNSPKIWDIKKGELLHTLHGHQSSIIAVAVTPDGRRVISASSDHDLKVWDAERGVELHTLYGHVDYIQDIEVTSDGQYAVSASNDKTLRVWNIERGTVEHILSGHRGGITQVAVTPDGQYAVSASMDATLKVWDLGKGEELYTLHGHSEPVSTVAITADGQMAISGSVDTTLKVWDLKTGEELRTLHGHDEAITVIVMTSDGSLAISTSSYREHTLKIWDLMQGRELRTLSIHSAQVTALALLPGEQYAVSASLDRTIKIWDLEHGTVIATFVGESAIGSCVVTADGSTIVAGEESGRVHFLQLEGYHELLEADAIQHSTPTLDAGSTPSTNSMLEQSSQLPVLNQRTRGVEGAPERILDDVFSFESSALSPSVHRFGGSIFGYIAVAEISFGGETFPFCLVGEPLPLCLGQTVLLRGDSRGYVPGGLTHGSRALIVRLRSPGDDEPDHIVQVIQENDGDYFIPPAWVKPSNIQRRLAPLIVGDPAIRSYKGKGSIVDALTLFSHSTRPGERHAHIVALEYQVAGEQQVVWLGEQVSVEDAGGKTATAFATGFTLQRKAGEDFSFMIAVRMEGNQDPGQHMFDIWNVESIDWWYRKVRREHGLPDRPF